MKKSLLTAAVVLGASAIVVAEQRDTPMALNQDGIGQVLIYPYYNVNDGFDTHFSVVNTSDTYRAVKVRINEGKNSWEVLDFNLYLSPQDVWSGVLHKYEDGTIRILTSDSSCTLPVIPKAHEVGAFIDSGIRNRLDPALRYTNMQQFETETDDKGKLFYQIEDAAEKYTNAYYSSRASEGYIEVIDMGQVLGERDNDHKNALLSGIKHVNGVPGNCDAVQDFYDVYWSSTSKAYGPDYGIFNDGENALMGTATLINVGQGLSGGYNAVAIKNFVTAETAIKEFVKGAPGAEGAAVAKNEKETVRANRDNATKAFTLHNLPGSSYPNLNAQVERGKRGSAEVLHVNTVNEYVQVNGAYIPTYDTEGKVVSKKAASGIFSVKEGAELVVHGAVGLSAVLMAKEVVGEYVVDPGLRASSDWIITMPTKHFFVNYNSTGDNIGQFGFVAGKNAAEAKNGEAKKPFGTSVFDKGGAATPIKISYYNREEADNVVKPGVDFSPSFIGASKNNLLSEVSLLNFSNNKDAQLFQSMGRSQIDLEKDFLAGWAKVEFGEDENLLSKAASRDLTTGEYRLYGLPVVGISATKYVNGSVGGVLSNYMAIQNLNYKRDNQVGPNGQ